MKSPFARREPAAPTSAATSEGTARKEPTSLAELAPSRPDVLAQAAYFELVLFQELSDLVSEAPKLTGKQALGQAAGEALERNEAFLARLTDEGVDADRQLERVSGVLDAFVERIRGRDANERILACYLVAGFVHDVFRELVGQFPAAPKAKVEPLLDDSDDQEMIAGVVRAIIASSPTEGDRIAVWGRRIVGDCILLVRQLFGLPAGKPAPVAEAALVDAHISSLLANHSRRMNAIGLAA